MTISDSFSSDAKPVGLRDLLIVTLVGVVGGSVFAAAALTAWALYLFAVGGLPPDHVGDAVQQLMTGFSGTMLLIVAFYLPVLGVMWRSARQLGARALARFFPPVSMTTVLLALSSGAAICILLAAMESVLSETYGIRFDLTSPERAMMPTTPAQIAVCIVVTSLIAPLAEELYFRGFLLGWLRRWTKAPLAVVLSALVFAAVHGLMLIHPGISGWIATGEIFVVGVALGYFVVRSGSLWSSFALHAAYNGAVTLHAYFWPS